MTFKLNPNNDHLSTEELQKLTGMRKRCARRILLSTALAASGHPGGSLSSLDLLLVTYGLMNHKPDDPCWQDRDRVVMSIGHISPGVYSVLSEYGYFSEEEFLTGFRRAGSGFPGHVEKIVPGVEWDTGNLGQGLSVGVGMAMAMKLKGSRQKVIVFVGDGDLQKGQAAEAMRFASKFKLNNLIVIIDRNHLQICGGTDEIMPCDIPALFASSGWNVELLDDGHDYNKIFNMLSAVYNGKALKPERPTVINARTVMGKGISFMENLAKYHGSPLKVDQLALAFAELGVENDYDRWAKLRTSPVSAATRLENKICYPDIVAGMPVVYGADQKTDCRSAYGTALYELAKVNNIPGQTPKIVGVSCDLEGSVKMGDFRKHMPEAFLECGIQEHHAATMAGAISREEMAAFFSTFGVFAVSEVYNQNRLNDINHTNVKVVATHLGLDVGEDGPTHQGIDFIGLMRNYFNFQVFLPADPNQTDKIVRHVATVAGNHFVGMGRSKMGMVLTEDGTPFFGAGYKFIPGKGDWVRRGGAGTIISYGTLSPQVMSAWQKLHDEGIAVSILLMASIVPIDRESVIAAARSGGPLLSVEDHHVDTGLGAIISTILADEGIGCGLKRLGVAHYGSSGKPGDLYAEQGLDADGIVRTFKSLL
ncbi:MAG: transketolase [Deltaproteobacteria bacterium]|nr:transketolase [Deltaproteobacteria bacterium]